MPVTPEHVKRKDELGKNLTRYAAVACWIFFGVSACGREASRQPAVETSTEPPARLQDASGPWKAGIHYTRIQPPQPLDGPAGKIEVVEAFWYGCEGCYVLEPRLVLWERTIKPDYIHFVRLPAVLSPAHRAHARLFYTLQALGRGDLHQAVYDTIHRAGSPLLAGTEAETFQRQLEFAEAHGIPEDEFTRVYSSSAVTTAVERAEQLAKSYRIDHTPMLIVNRSYQTDVARAGGDDYLLGVVQHLVDRALRE